MCSQISVAFTHNFYFTKPVPEHSDKEKTLLFLNLSSGVKDGPCVSLTDIDDYKNNQKHASLKTKALIKRIYIEVTLDNIHIFWTQNISLWLSLMQNHRRIWGMLEEIIARDRMCYPMQDVKLTIRSWDCKCSLFWEWLCCILVQSFHMASHYLLGIYCVRWVSSKDEVPISTYCYGINTD